jgi:hypothetical protein
VITPLSFQTVWPHYRASGWPVFPLRPGAKTPPPDGATGWDGVDWSGADCAEADELPAYRGTRQTAVRMPSTTVGLDVDAYGDKTGGQTLGEGVRRWGPLPEGPWSSARDDGVSGIRFFRVPDGTVLVPNLTFPELKLGHVEVIQRHHRYAVVWPSVHPIGTSYTWRGTAGPGTAPAVDDLPELPQPWLDGLVGVGRQGQRALPEQVECFLAGLPSGPGCPAVRAALRDAVDALRAPVVSRHDDTCVHVLRILRCGEQGHPGAAAALGTLKHRFVQAVTADDSRTSAAADGEFDRMVEGDNGIGLILTNPTPPNRHGCRCAVAPQVVTTNSITGLLRKVLAASPDEQPRLLAWAIRKLRGWAAAGQLEQDQAARLVEQLTSAAGGTRG